MPLNATGRKIKKAMEHTYGSKQEGDRVFYASENSGRLKYTTGRRLRGPKRKRHRRKRHVVR